MEQTTDGCWTCTNPNCEHRGRAFYPVCQFEERAPTDRIEAIALT